MSDGFGNPHSFVASLPRFKARPTVASNRLFDRETFSAVAIITGMSGKTGPEGRAGKEDDKDKE
jgi:hypothetical protein